MTYGQFNFKRGWFDLVLEADADQGQIQGYIKPLFRNLTVFDVIEEGVPVRRRRVCCLQYLLPDRRFCKACPIEEARAPVAANRIP